MYSFILFLIVISASLCYYYRQIYSPRRLHHKLIQEFSKKQWKVFIRKFVPFGTSVYGNEDISSKKQKDGLSNEKYTISNYDVTLANLSQKQFILVHHPQLIKQFYQLDSENVMRKQNFFIESIIRLVGSGLTYSEGSLWKEKRKIMSQFLNFQFLKKQNPKILRFVDQQFSKFFTKNQYQNLKDNKNSPQGYLLEIIENVPSQYINEIYFSGSKLNFELQNIDGVLMPKYLREILEQLHSHAADTVPRFFGFLGIQFLRFGLRKKDKQVNAKIKKFRNLVGDFFRARIKEIDQENKDQTSFKEPKDLTQAFYFNFLSEKQKVSKQDFINALINDYTDLMNASAENIGLTCLMLVYYVYQSPERKNRLVKELESELKVLDTENVENLRQLKYLQCCITEALRLYQSATGMFPRELLTDIELDGIKIQKGSVVSVPFYEVHYRDILYEDAKDFKPERWLSEKGDIIRTDLSTFVTFGGGARSCIGRHLTFAQMRIVVAYFFLNFQAEFQTLDLQMGTYGQVAYEPQPIKMKLKKKGN